MSTTPTTPPPGEHDSPTGTTAADLERARSLLLLLADTHPDAIWALVPEVALFHLDDIHPPPAPTAPAEIDLRGDALHDEAVAALIPLCNAAEDPGLRGRAMKALYEMTTPIHFAPSAGPALADVERGDREVRG